MSLPLAPAPRALPPDRARRHGNGGWLPSPKMAPRASRRRRHLEPGRAGSNGQGRPAAIFPRALPEGEAAISEEGSPLSDSKLTIFNPNFCPSRPYSNVIFPRKTNLIITNSEET